jgi:glycosyltransferase involved in cell wall biosynthesis
MEINKIKLCHLITQTHFGGAQKYICDIVNNLDDSFEITIAFGEGKKEDLQKYITNPRVKFKKLKFLTRNINIFKDKMSFGEILFFCKKNKFDILHLHSSKAGFIGSWAAKLAGVKKIIYTAHGWVFKENLGSFKKGLYIFLEKFSARFKDKIICVSKNDYDEALKNKISKEEKLVLIYNGLQLSTKFLEKENAREEIFKKIRETNKHDSSGLDLLSLEVDSDRPITKYVPLNQSTQIIGTISNLYLNKGLEYLVESAKKLNSIYNNLIFIVIGSGPEEARLKDLVIKKELSNFYFLGKIDEASKYLKALDIFTLTSIKEGLPYTLLEALGAEISIVSSNLESLTEIIENGQNGLIFKATDSDNLVYKIQSLLNNQEFANKLKSNTKNSLSKFNFNEFINNIKNLYLG